MPPRLPRGSRKNNLAESAALNPTRDLTNAQFPMLNSHPKWMSDCQMFRRTHPPEPAFCQVIFARAPSGSSIEKPVAPQVFQEGMGRQHGHVFVGSALTRLHGYDNLLLQLDLFREGKQPFLIACRYTPRSLHLDSNFLANQKIDLVSGMSAPERQFLVDAAIIQIRP